MQLLALSEPRWGRVATSRALDAAFLLRQELLIFADQSEHRAQSFMRDYFALMRMRQFVELPVSEISPIVSDLDATIRVVDHSDAFAGESLVLADRIYKV